MLGRRALCRLSTLRKRHIPVCSRGVATYSRHNTQVINYNRSKSKSWIDARQLSSHEQTTNPDHHVKRQNGDSSLRSAELLIAEESATLEDGTVAEIEKRLGKSIGQAIHEDELADLTEKDDSNVTEESHSNQILTSPASNRLSELRDGNAPNEDIVHAARTIHGEYLPESVLSTEEMKLYTRLYGEPPLRDSSLDEVSSRGKSSQGGGVSRNVLLSAEGEHVPYHLESEHEIEANPNTEQTVDQTSKNIMHLQSRRADLEDIAKAVNGDFYDQEEYDESQYEEEEDGEAADERTHPLTRIGKFSTFPRTFFMPKDTFVQPVQEIMKDYSNKHLKEMCERTFGGPGLPDSPLTPRIGQFRQQLPVPLNASQQLMGQMEANAFVTTVMPPTYASIRAILTETRKRLGSSWLNRLLAKAEGPRVLDAGSGGVGILAWRDIMNAHWEQLHSSDKSPPALPPSKSVVLTGSDALRHRAASMLENTTFVPRLPDYVHTRQNPTLDDNRPAQQRKYFDVIIASHSLFGLKEEFERKQHVQNLWQLLDPLGGVLIFVEKGIPRGFETIAAARELLLERYIATPKGQRTYFSAAHSEDDLNEETKMPGMIVAPCTNHDRCPLYKAVGLSKGRKDFCSFQQRYIRPPFLQRVLGAKDLNHDDVDFSYVAVMKGEDLRQRSFTSWEHVNDPISAPIAKDHKSAADLQTSTVSQIQRGFEGSNASAASSAPPPTHLLPRILSAPIKRHGHVTVDLCTPSAEIKRWTIPKSFSRQAYRDARKAHGGDLWALGAKTSTHRNLKTGTPSKDLVDIGGQMREPNAKPRSRKERLQMQADKEREAKEAQVVQEDEEAEHEELMKLIDEDNLLDEEDDDELAHEENIRPISQATQSYMPFRPTRRSPPIEENDDDDDDLIDMDTLLPKKRRTMAKSTMSSDLGVAAIAPRHSMTPTKKKRRGEVQEDSVPTPTKQSLKAQRRAQDEFATVSTADAKSMRIGEVDELVSWSENFDSIMRDDEAYSKVSRYGGRATSKNTARMKRNLRRAKRM